MKLGSGVKGPVIGIALVNAATLTWATNMALGRWLRAEIGPLTLTAARFTIAAPVLTLFYLRSTAHELRTAGDRRLVGAMALVGVVLFGPTLYLGLRYTTTVSATLINGLCPLITGLLATLLIREPMSRRQLGGALLGLIGVTVLISEGSLAFWRNLSANIGMLIILGAVILWSLYSVIGRQVMHLHSPLSATVRSMWIGLPFLLAAAGWEVTHSAPNLTPEVLLAIGYIGLVPTVVGYLAWNAGVRRLGPSGAMIFYNSLPLYGALLGILVLGESGGIVHLVGGLLIIGGGLWAAWQGREQSAPHDRRELSKIPGSPQDQGNSAGGLDRPTTPEWRDSQDVQGKPL
jgi:drug/metabolite transporter (DMT)-like permease